MPVSNDFIKDTAGNNNPQSRAESGDNPKVVPNQPVPEIPAFERDIPGLSGEELTDPNKIFVTIADKRTPLVILFGPKTCGKTMTLVRLTRYLRSKGYTVDPVKTFRPSRDKNYIDMCEEFDDIVASNDAAKGTSRISFMLVEILKEGKPICQILEAPGEFYFDNERPNRPFPNYVNTIISSPNRKIWAIMVEPNWLDEGDRMNYVERIKKLKTHMRSIDNTIIVYNKIDLTHFVMSIGQVNTSHAFQKVEDDFPGIFNEFKNLNPITRIFKPFNCDFVPFQTGFYTDTDEGGKTFQNGPAEYCEKLWGSIKKCITG